MKKIVLLLIAVFGFTTVSAQTANTKKKKANVEQSAVKDTDKDLQKDKKTTQTRPTNAAQPATVEDNGGLIDATDTPTEGSNSRNNSRQNTYNTKDTGTGTNTNPGNAADKKTDTTTPRP